MDRARAARSGFAESSTPLRPVSAQPDRPPHRRDRRGARPRLRPPRRRHGPVGDPLRPAERAGEALGYELDDRGNVDAELAEALTEGDPTARYWDAIKATCEQLAAESRRPSAPGELPLVLGGDHSIAIGTLGGLAAAHGGPGGLIWFDAHTDMNTPDTSPSGNVHGMPLAVALGMTDDPRFRERCWPLPMLTDTRPS